MPESRSWDVCGSCLYQQLLILAGLACQLCSSLNKKRQALIFGKYKQSLSVPSPSWFSLESDIWLPAGSCWQLVSLNRKPYFWNGVAWDAGHGEDGKAPQDQRKHLWGRAASEQTP